MTHHSRTFLGLVLLCAVSSPSLGQITFERTYGGISGDHAWSVVRTDDGGYILAGETYSFGAGAWDFYLVKTDSFGDSVWTRTYGGVLDDYGCFIQQTRDGGYIVAGQTSSFGAGAGDVYIVKTDSFGDTVWTRTYGGNGWDIAYSIQQTGDGGYVIAGETSSSGAGSWDVYLIKTDSAGDSAWTRTFGGASEDFGSSVAQTQDGGFVIGGRTSSFGAGSFDVYLVRTDSAGDSLWARTFGGLTWDFGYSVAQTQDGGYIIAGEASSFGAGSGDVYIIKTDSAGDSAWTRTYGASSEDYGYSIQQTEDGGYVIAGKTESFGAGSGDVYLIKMDSVGDSLWTRTYGGISGDYAASVQETQDGGYVIAGGTESFGAGLADAYLIKTGADGSTGADEDVRRPLATGFVLFQNRPNPFLHSTVISYSLPCVSRVTVSIYDVSGRLTERLVNETLEPGIHQVRWNRNSKPSGVYFYMLTACPEPLEGRIQRAGEFEETRKMVVVE